MTIVEHRSQRGAPLWAWTLALLLVLSPARGGQPLKASHSCFHDRITEIQRNSSKEMGMPAMTEGQLRPLEKEGVLQSTYRYLSSFNTKTGDEWKPIRVQVSTLDVSDASKYCRYVGQVVSDFAGETAVCAEEEILTTNKRNMLLNIVLPQAISLHTERLNVRPLAGSLVVPGLTGSVCGSFNVPSIHRTMGLSNTDFALYVSAAPTEDSTIAWSITCSFLNGRPVVGATNISPRYIANSRTTVRTAAHELMHALGFNQNMFSTRKMTQHASMRGKSTTLINSTNVRAKAREHYSCNTMAGMELEDEGGPGTMLSHWERRNAKDELMAGIAGSCFYTSLSIAAMEDTGYYKGNYANAETMEWGRSQGCDLLNNKCIVNGVSQVPRMFCLNNYPDQCTSDRTGYGPCDIGTLDHALPAYFQYFSSATVGGTSGLTDYCPVITSYSNTDCVGFSGDTFPGFVSSNSARCFNGYSVQPKDASISLNGLCVNVKCDQSSLTYAIHIRGAKALTPCTPGERLSLEDYSKSFDGGSIVCPPFDEVCVNNIWTPDGAVVFPLGVLALMAPFALLMLFAV